MSEEFNRFLARLAGDGKFYSIDAGGLEEILGTITEHVSGLRLTQ